ncbi:MAG: SDR family oxidoreductase [Chloroflexi bacterium]|nr:SDR family oxidoreductase [Chloroflexota bacterium]MCC6893332.1 SDR family oxidoreductase [Anaerolineae bacterium]
MIHQSMSPRIALVTGASRRIGIGFAVCKALAAAGMDVAFTYWQPYDSQMEWGVDADAPAMLAAELQALGVRCLPLEADLTKLETPATLLDTVEQQLGPVSVLVNNATYSTTGGYQELDVTMLDAHYAVNMRGTFMLSVEFARRFKTGKGGRVINLTSGQSLGPMPSELAYVATKGAVEAFTLSLAGGVAKLGITVNAVDPGPTDTGWMGDDLKAYLSSRTPAGRVGLPEDIAKLIAFLASEDSEWVTGQVIHSNGGFGWA